MVGALSHRLSKLESTVTNNNKPLIFTGDGWEYFKIWIVNIVLTLLTLGIYSAWAKVRRKRYFYGNTRLNNSAFEYLADPLAILKGRLIAFAIFSIFVVAGNFFPGVDLVLWLIFLPFLPWVIIKALSFNARNSAYRNIRFNFEARYVETLLVFLVFPFLMIFTFGLAYPYVVYKQKKFLIGNHSYGQTPFLFGARILEFYKVYGTALLGGIIFVTALALALYSVGISEEQILAYPNQPHTDQFSLIGIAFLLGFMTFYFSLFAFIHISIQNLCWSRNTLANIGFESRLKTLPYLWLFISNAIAVVCSIGLLIPWAQIRMTRYRLDNLSLELNGSLDQFVAGEQKKVGATGEQVGEFFDIDLSL